MIYTISLIHSYDMASVARATCVDLRKSDEYEDAKGQTGSPDTPTRA